METFADVGAAIKSQIHFDLASFAKSENNKVLQSEPRPLAYEKWVDGQRGVAEETVKTGGIIVYEYNRYDIVANWILDELRKQSPVKDGDYVSGHTIYLNGTEAQDLHGWKDGDEISITNYVPYSRKIEVGTIHGKPIKLSVRPHIYERTARAARQRFKDIADISFTYRGIVGGQQIDALKVGALKPIKNKKTGRFVNQGGGGKHNKSDQRYPAITINPPGSFTTRAGLLNG